LSQDQGLALAVTALALSALADATLGPILDGKETPTLVVVVTLSWVVVLYSWVKSQLSRARVPGRSRPRRLSIGISLTVLVLGTAIAVAGAAFTTDRTWVGFRLLLGLAGLLAWCAGMLVWDSLWPLSSRKSEDKKTG
jgi:hypothetical protein